MKKLLFIILLYTAGFITTEALIKNDYAAVTLSNKTDTVDTTTDTPTIACVPPCPEGSCICPKAGT